MVELVDTSDLSSDAERHVSSNLTEGIQMNHEEALPFIQDQLLAIATNGASCVLCGSATNNPAVFYTNEEYGKKIGAPEGKQRVIVYAICTYCQKKKDSIALVEAELIKDYNLATEHERN